MNVIGEKALIDSVIREIKNAGAVQARLDNIEIELFAAQADNKFLKGQVGEKIAQEVDREKLNVLIEVNARLNTSANNLLQRVNDLFEQKEVLFSQKQNLLSKTQNLYDAAEAFMMRCRTKAQSTGMKQAAVNLQAALSALADDVVPF